MKYEIWYKTDKLGSTSTFFPTIGGKRCRKTCTKLKYERVCVFVASSFKKADYIYKHVLYAMNRIKKAEHSK